MTQTIFLALALSSPVCAQDTSKDASKDIFQDTSINDLKRKIFDAKTVQQRFTSGLRHYSELNGSQSGRVLPVFGEFYLGRHVQCRNQAAIDQAGLRCALGAGDGAGARQPALVASLPFLQKKLDEMQKQANQQQSPAPQGAAPGK